MWTPGGAWSGTFLTRARRSRVTGTGVPCRPRVHTLARLGVEGAKQADAGPAAHGVPLARLRRAAVGPQALGDSLARQRVLRAALPAPALVRVAEVFGA